MARTEPRIDLDFVRFLANAYEITLAADYDAEPEALVSMADAMANIETAVRLLDCIGELIEPPQDVAP